MSTLCFSKSELLDSLLNAVLVVNKELKLCYMNQSAEEMIGRSFTHVKNKPIHTILTSPQFEKHIEQAFSSHQRQVARGGKITVRGSYEINIDCTVTPLFQDDAVNGEVTGILFELSQVDRQIRIARETRLISNQIANQHLLRGLAHEIKNPLGGLRGAAQLLEMQYNDPNITEYTHVIITEADRLSTLVDNMLASNQAAEKTQVNIHEVLEHVRQLTIVKLPPTIQLKRDYDPSIPEFQGNFDQLVQTALNLLNNAITALEKTPTTPNNDHYPKEIILKTRVTRNFTLHKKNYPLVLCAQIIDNGMGIPEALQDKIFYPMVTGHADGTGLGLSIAQTLINQHNGLIEFDSNEKRTIFSIIIPIGQHHE